jgi:hypothetical protein
MHAPTEFQIKMSKNKEKSTYFLISPTIAHQIYDLSEDPISCSPPHFIENVEKQ